MPELTDTQAVAIATQAIAGRVTRQAGSPVEVARAEGRITVTFVHATPAHMLGADYDARVCIDAATGAVLQVLLGA